MESIPRIAKEPSETGKPESLRRAPEKLDPVSTLVKELFPGSRFLVVVWTPSKPGKAAAEMITNSDLDEVAGLLRVTAGEMEETSRLKKLNVSRGHA